MLPIVFGDAAQAVCEHCDDLWTIADQCRWLSLETELGAALFRNTAATASIVEFNKTINETIPKVMVEPYTEVSHREALKKLFGIVDDFKKRGLPEVARTITLPYLGFHVSILVKDLRWECQVRLAAAMKQRALGKAQGLALTTFEQWFIEESAEVCTVDEKLLAGAKLCREMVADMLRDTSLDSIGGINHALTMASDSLLRADPFWVIEQSFLSTSMTESMTQKLQQKVMDILPSTSHRINEDKALSDLEALEGSSLYRLAPAPAKGALDVTKDLVMKLKANVSPPSHLVHSTDFFKKVLKAVENFITMESPPSGSNQAATVLIGVDALQAKIKELHRQGATVAKVAEIEKCLVWRHLLSQENVAILTDLLKKIVAKDPGSRRRDGAVEEKKEKKKKKEAVKQDDISQFF